MDKPLFQEQKKWIFQDILEDIDRIRPKISHKKGLDILTTMMQQAMENTLPSTSKEEYVYGIAEHINPYSYERRIPYETLCTALETAERKGWRLRFELDPEYLSEEEAAIYLQTHPKLTWNDRIAVGSRRDQNDGWSYHIEFDKEI